MPPFRILPACLIALLALAGCAQIPPDRNVAPAPDFARAGLAASIHPAQDGWPQAQWWREYGDAQLDRLMQQGLQHNPALAQVHSRIASAHAVLGSETAQQGWHTTLAGGANRQRYSANGLLPAPIGGNYFNDVALQAKAQYEFDWWGKHRAQIAAAVGEVNARQADYAQAGQTLAAAIAQRYFRLQALWAHGANLQQRITLQQAMQHDIASRMAHGLAVRAQQQEGELMLAQLQEQAAQISTQAGREREGLRALVGADKDALGDLAPQLPVALPTRLPAKLGLELLARRADLQAARWRVEATLGKVSAAEAAFYPDINLLGSFGLDAIALDKLAQAGSRTPFIGATIELPLFDQRRLRSALDAARARRNEVMADYNQLVLDAVRDVAQEAVTLQGLQDQMQRHDAVRAAASAQWQTVQKRVRQGLAGRSELLQAERLLREQDDAALSLQAAQWQTGVALVKALGGGFRQAPLAAPLATAPHMGVPAAPHSAPATQPSFLN